MAGIISNLYLKVQNQSKRLLLINASVCIGATVFAVPALSAEVVLQPTLNTFGLPGLIDMPTADVLPDGQISATLSHASGVTRNTVLFQVAPRLTGSFRYSIHHGSGVYNLDRSFDLRYKLLDEGPIRPAVAIGLKDFIGTGIYSGEYLVSTKHLSPRLKVTGGIGWGRFATYGSFRNPLAALGLGFQTRPPITGLGGVPNVNQFFRGPAAFFGGVEWQTPIARLSVKAEYSSDGVTDPITSRLIAHRSPWNFSLNYRLKSGALLSAYYLYGSTFGFSGTYSLNPAKPLDTGSRGAAPLPVLSRPHDVPYDTSWVKQPDGASILRGNVQALLAADGQQLESMRVNATSVEVRFRNKTHDAAPEAIGRVARVLSRVMPSSVDTFVIVPMDRGMPLVAVTLNRSDVEALENDQNGAAEMLKRAKISDGRGPRKGFKSFAGLYPRFDWSLKPYLAASFFDPTNPVRADLGLRLKAEYEIRPGLILSGSIKKRIVGNMNTVTRVSNSIMPVHVRSDYGLYDNAGDPAIDHLTAEYFFRPGKNLFGRVTVGYLEKMYGGVSVETLWKPGNGKFAFGLEINAVKQRAYNQLFGFKSYGVVTGHASVYWDMGNGFFSQVDVGRYLAGDYGAMYALDRVFDNGWKVGAFFTLTNVPFATFGEGSFNKGLRLSIPLSWITRKPTLSVKSLVMSPISRDGGAQLDVRNRLYGLVENYRGDRLTRRWGRFWR